MNKPLNFVALFALAAGLTLIAGCSTVRQDKAADTLYLDRDILIYELIFTRLRI